MAGEMEALAARHERLSLTLAVRDGSPGAVTGLVGDVAPGANLVAETPGRTTRVLPEPATSCASDSYGLCGCDGERGLER